MNARPGNGVTRRSQARVGRSTADSRGLYPCAVLLIPAFAAVALTALSPAFYLLDRWRSRRWRNRRKRPSRPIREPAVGRVRCPAMSQRPFRDALLPMSAAALSMAVSSALLRAGERGWLLYQLMFAASAAAGLVCVLLIWRTARVRQRRLAAGLCPGCGYDLRATPGGCPECGRAAAV